MQFEAISNEAAMASGGAGIRAAQTVSSTGAEVVITGSVGPNAYPALESAGIEIMTGASGSVRSAVEEFLKGSLSSIKTPGAAHLGMGMGGGGGMGMGGGGGGYGGGGGGRGQGGGGRGQGGGGRGRGRGRGRCWSD